MDSTLVAMGIGFAVQLIVIGYSYGGLNQKVKDVDTRLARVENKLNGGGHCPVCAAKRD